MRLLTCLLALLIAATSTTGFGQTNMDQAIDRILNLSDDASASVAIDIAGEVPTEEFTRITQTISPGELERIQKNANALLEKMKAGDSVTVGDLKDAAVSGQKSAILLPLLLAAALCIAIGVTAGYLAAQGHKHNSVIR